MKKKPIATIALIVLCVIYFIFEDVKGGSTDEYTFLNIGALNSPKVLENGEYWRWVTSIFIHIGIVHLVTNIYSLYYLGSLLERIVNSWKFLIVYFSSGVGANIIYTYLSRRENIISAGASGAIFGVLGCLLVLVLMKKTSSIRINVNWLITIVGINLISGLLVKSINFKVHVFGFIIGLVIGYFIGLTIKKEPSREDLFYTREGKRIF